MLFGSLHNRILVFFSVLTVSVQLMCYLVVSQTNEELVVAQKVSHKELVTQTVTQLINTEYSRIDQALNHALLHLKSDVKNVNKISALIESLVSYQGQSNSQLDVLKNQDAQFNIVLSNNDGQVHYATHTETLSSYILEPVTRRFADRPAEESFVHAGYFIDDKLYLSSSVDVGERQRLTMSVYISNTVLPAIEKIINTSMQVQRHNASANATGNEQSVQNAIYSVPLATMEDIVIVSVPRAVENFASLLESQNTKLKLLLAASLGVLLLMGYALAYELTKPLKALTQAAKKMKAGDYTEAVQVQQRDEIGQLAATIDHMRKRVAHREEKIRKLAYADPLTGLPNRALFDDRLNRAVSTGQRIDSPFSVLILDMDRFKYINDVLGHEAGDYVLKEVSTRLESALRESDTVARLGGDEFALLLLSNSDDDIISAVNKIVEVFEEPVTLNNQPIDIGCSIGIAKFPEHGQNASILLRRADIAMYSAKRFSKPFAFYNPECDDHQQEHLSLLSDIKRAIEFDELQLYFQPKVSFNDSSLVSVETLLRWQHPKRGLIPPEEFIPFAEQTGAIRLITRWLIKNVFKQAGHWCEENVPIKVSLNISARDLLDPEFPGFVAEALKENSVQASSICMEITESALMEDPIKARKTVEVLHEMGVEISIDDYGTGYSSLAYVKNLPVNELKIDCDFVMNMLENEEDIAIVRSTIELGHNLGLKVVAEGIEHEQVLQMLKDFGCDQGQGFLISQALTATDLLKWIDENKNIDTGIVALNNEYKAREG